MKIADDFIKVCLNYDDELKTVLKELEEKDPNNYYCWGRDAGKMELKSRLFILEEDDFHKAIKLCKVYKRSIQKQAYEYKLKKFKETGEYFGDYRKNGFTFRFIDDLRHDLYGRRNNYDKRMLVNASMKELFPEAKEVSDASTLIDFCSRTKDYEINYEKAQETLLEHQSKINKIHDLEEEGKSVADIVEMLKEQEEE